MMPCCVNNKNLLVLEIWYPRSKKQTKKQIGFLSESQETVRKWF